ncbi:MAG TPA: hypothetical protein VKY19_04210 [Ktedonosporobacter sp.]|jgi:hypothetical protein|nr:hypothetical protein [Ktedonosporobacter sp.]
MQQTKRPAPADDALLDDQLEEGEEGYLPEFPTQPFRVTLPKGRLPVPPRASRLRVSQALPDQQQQQDHLCQQVRRTEEDQHAATLAPTPFVVIEILLSHPQDNRVYVLSGFRDLSISPILTLGVQHLNVHIFSNYITADKFFPAAGRSFQMSANS